MNLGHEKNYPGISAMLLHTFTSNDEENTHMQAPCRSHTVLQIDRDAEEVEAKS